MVKPTVSTDINELHVILLSSARDGRGRNARYRQNQLHYLHSFLRENAESILTAIGRDSIATKVEADVEYNMSLAAVGKLYNEIDFAKSLEDEYRIAKHEDNIEARIPYGVVLIRPTLHNRFFSIITAVATALAAGNMVLLELEYDRLSVDGFFRTEFDTYDREALAIASARIDDALCPKEYLLVDQSSNRSIRTNILTHHQEGLVVATLDRATDVSKAARAIIRSKLFGDGTSPNAVDIVLINEWVKENFIASCEEAIKANEDSIRRVLKSSTSQQMDNSIHGDVNSVLDIDGFVISEVDPSAVSSLHKSDILQVKLVTVSGLVNTVTVASKMNSLLVLFCFASDHQAKYLGQHIDCQLFVVNQIPVSLLVGPSLPISSITPDPVVRYNTRMMSRPAPKFISDLDCVLSTSNIDGRVTLKPVKQGSGFDIGFFDRGAILGAATIVLPTAGIMFYACYQVIMQGHRWLLM